MWSIIGSIFKAFSHIILYIHLVFTRTKLQTTCISTHAHTCAHTHTHTHTHNKHNTHTKTHTHAYTYTHIHTCTYTHTYLICEKGKLLYPSSDCQCQTTEANVATNYYLHGQFISSVVSYFFAKPWKYRDIT